MRGQKSVPPKKNLASLRVGSLHANKEGKLFKVVRLASNKKVWRVGRAKPKPKPKKTNTKSKPERHTLKGGSKKLEEARRKHEEKHITIKRMFCNLLAKPGSNKSDLQKKFEEVYGQVGCTRNSWQVEDDDVLVDLVFYVSNNTGLGCNKMGCVQCMTFLNSQELDEYVHYVQGPDFLNTGNKKKSIVYALNQAKRLVANFNPVVTYEDSETYGEMDLAEIQRLNKLH